jgi:Dullard-like phosphatase family protein
MVLEEKLNEIILALNKNHSMHNECFEFWNYYFNCSFYGKLETLFKSEDDQNNVQLSINHILISVMICYDFSFEIDILNNEYSILIDILNLNHRNLIIIYEHILSKISSESMSNPWVYKLKEIVNNFNKIDDSNYISNDGRILNVVEKIMYNVSVIVQNIRVLLKNYKTRRSEYLTSIFKKIGEKSYDEINSFFRDNILRVDNVKGSVLASVFLKENQYFKTEPAPYIKTKNRKPYSLILDLDETLVHFKVNSEDDSEGVLQIRPGVISFLELVGKFYELIIFTAATQDYGDLLIDAIEENNVYFEHRFYRQHTVIMGNDFIKDLTRVGRPLDKIIIVDNMPQNFRLQKENGINIKAFWGEDVNDNALEELGKILVNIARDGGDVRIGLEKYRDEIVKKVTSNISRNNY